MSTMYCVATPTYARSTTFPVDRVRLAVAELDLLRPDPDGHPPGPPAEHAGRTCISCPFSSRTVPAPLTVPAMRFDTPRKPATYAVAASRTAPSGPELLDLPAVHHGDLVRHRHRLFLVVRDVDERDADVVLDPFSSSCICLRSLRSSAPSGSSSSSTRGLLTSARASATRCCWPPESCRGLRVQPGEADELEHLLARARAALAAHAAPPQAEGDVLEDRQVREERVRLEDRVDVPLVGRQPADARGRRARSALRSAARSRRSSAASSSCRSPTGRAARRSCRARSRGRSRRRRRGRRSVS